MHKEIKKRYIDDYIIQYIADNIECLTFNVVIPEKVLYTLFLTDDIEYNFITTNMILEKL